MSSPRVRLNPTDEVLYCPPAAGGRKGFVRWRHRAPLPTNVRSTKVKVFSGGRVREVEAQPISITDLVRQPLERLHDGSASASAWAHIISFGTEVLTLATELDGTTNPRGNARSAVEVDRIVHQTPLPQRYETLIHSLPLSAHAIIVREERPRRVQSPPLIVRAALDDILGHFMRATRAPASTRFVVARILHTLDAGLVELVLHLEPIHGAGASCEPGVLDDETIAEEITAVTPVEVDGKNDIYNVKEIVNDAVKDQRPAGSVPTDQSVPDEPDLPKAEFRVWPELHSRIDRTTYTDAETLVDDEANADPALGLDPAVHLWSAMLRAADIAPALRPLTELSIPASADLTVDEAVELLDATYELRAKGIKLALPREIVKPTIRVEQPMGKPHSSGLFGMANLLGTRYLAVVDGQALEEDEFDQLVQAKRPLVQIGNTWYVMDPRSAARTRERIKATPGELAAMAVSGQVEDHDIDDIVDVEVLGPVADAVSDALQAREVEMPEPPRFVGDLRPHQRRALSWLASLDRSGVGGALLADYMGLGKTISAIAFHLHRLAHGCDKPTLVIAKAKTINNPTENWPLEFGVFSPSTTVLDYRNGNRDLVLSSVGPNTVVLVSHELARADIAKLAAVDWGLVVVDEAQAVKNPTAKLTRALHRLRSEFRLLMTGTPYENSTVDLYSLMHLAIPGLLGGLEHFRQTYSLPIDGADDPIVIDRLGDILEPFVLVRDADDAGIQLPELIKQHHEVRLTVEQAVLYSAVVAETKERLERLSPAVRLTEVGVLLTRLKQICNHPGQYAPALLRQDGDLRHASGKFDAAMDLIQEITSPGASVLVFTQFVQAGQLLSQQLEREGIAHGFLYGGCGDRHAQRLVRDFNEGRFPVFLISLKAGGAGLNLTKATHVVHLDRWWNPAVEDQATMRAYRIGQTQPVTVHRLTTMGTLEERIDQLLTMKRERARRILGTGARQLSKLSNYELLKLVELTDEASAESFDEEAEL